MAAPTPVSEDALDNYMARTTEYLHAQELDDGTSEATARIDAIADDLDGLWNAMSPTQRTTASARLASDARKIFLPPLPPT